MIDFQLFGGFGDGRTDRRTDIGGCRVAFATENSIIGDFLSKCKKYVLSEF